jgi:lipoprotein NlpD
VLRRIVSGLLVCCLVACGGSGTRAPVEDRYGNDSPASSLYTVQRGDTLYSIAFRYRMDYRKVAAANGISAPYTIFAGQTLQLREATPAPVAAATTASVPRRLQPVITPPAPGVPASASKPAAVTGTAPSHGAAVVVKPAPGTTAASAPVKPPTPVYQGAARPAPVATGSVSTSPPARVTDWRWPSSGRVTRRYSASVHKGIDIGGRRGDPVYAVADGTVVYAGTGIVGFGELLIVKHNEIYLSAYGHNDRLLVKENDSVRAGQQIARKGSSGTDTVKLHFEIRKEGKPVDPLRLLPPR